MKRIIQLTIATSLITFHTNAAPSRTVSLDTRYFGAETNNHGFAEFGKEVIGLHNLAFNKISSKFTSTESGRMYMLLGDYVVSNVLGSAFLTVYHEHGHYNRLRAVGLKPHFKGRPSNFFSFFTRKLGSPYGSEATIASTTDRKFTPKDSQRYFNGNLLSNDWNIVMSGAGLNNEMRFAGDIGDKIIEGRGETTDFFFYLQGKTSTLTYSNSQESSGSDTKQMRTAYANKGYRINRNDMDRSNAIALFLSASTYMYGSSLFNYVKTGDTSVRALEFYGVQLPDVESYYTSKGISYKVKSGYRWKDWRFPISVEFVGKGKAQKDIKIGVIKSLPHFHNIDVRGDITMGKALGFTAQAIYPVIKNCEIAAGFTHENVKTFEGERNIMSVKKSSSHNQIWGRVSYKF